MARKIILHIGSPKCGSTYLQHAMLNNTAQLAQHGVSYPPSADKHPGNAADLADLTPQRFEQLFEQSDTIVFSHEDLFLMPKRGENLAAIAKTAGVSVQVIAFMRPFSQFIFGDYSQFMKQHFETFLQQRKPYGGRNFEQFTVDRSHALKPTPSFKAWQRLFPDTPIMVCSHKMIRPVLEELLKLDTLDWDVKHDKTNPSLRMEDCDALAASMNTPEVADTDIREAFKSAFKTTQASDLGKTPERIAWIEAIFAKHNADLLENFQFDNRLQE